MYTDRVWETQNGKPGWYYQMLPLWRPHHFGSGDCHFLAIERRSTGGAVAIIV
jgi:hypothetical protein